MLRLRSTTEERKEMEDREGARGVSNDPIPDPSKMLKVSPERFRNN